MNSVGIYGNVTKKLCDVIVTNKGMKVIFASLRGLVIILIDTVPFIPKSCMPDSYRTNSGRYEWTRGQKSNSHIF